ncbi:MAG TPA: hypothetical protein VJK51_05815 [Candidatus Nanoarchaeia archaeon]|nr:hypothetical protein [Candidatus Nanoarchaeia archaeon]
MDLRLTPLEELFIDTISRERDPYQFYIDKLVLIASNSDSVVGCYRGITKDHEDIVLQPCFLFRSILDGLDENGNPKYYRGLRASDDPAFIHYRSVVSITPFDRDDLLARLNEKKTIEMLRSAQIKEELQPQGLQNNPRQ